jgi:hypothetical protein
MSQEHKSTLTLDGYYVIQVTWLQYLVNKTMKGVEKATALELQTCRMGLRYLSSWLARGPLISLPINCQGHIGLHQKPSSKRTSNMEHVLKALLHTLYETAYV